MAQDRAVLSLRLSRDGSIGLTNIELCLMNRRNSMGDYRYGSQSGCMMNSIAGIKASALAIEGLMFEITAEASRHRVKALGCKPPSWLKQAEDLLKASFFETWALDGIANSVGIDPIHLAEGLTPSEYRAFRSR